jgi:hypothetical protein
MSISDSILNKLPKDVLISLIHCIEGKLKAENKILRKIISQISLENGGNYKECQSCDHITAGDYESCLGKGGACKFCKKYYCCYHIDRLQMYVHKYDQMWNSGPVCIEICAEQWTKPEHFNQIEDFDAVPCITQK